jgi:ubiquinone/menaquinone biosynthesis C-methylase UbiE
LKETLLKRHWYDGWIYSKIIDQKNSGLRKGILDVLPGGKKIIDIGCGTGGFVLNIAKRSEYVVGVDLSQEMIRIAEYRKQKTGIRNVKFIHANAKYLSMEIKEKFDYAILSFFVHENRNEDFMAIIKEVTKITNSIVFFDYNIPLPCNISGLIIRLIEFFAGREHFKNFKEYCGKNGLEPLITQTGLFIKENKVNSTKVFKIVVAE